jgi:hypothetical protein
MNELIEIFKQLDLIHWVLMMLGLISHGLMDYGTKKMKHQLAFSFPIFFETRVRPWLIALICATACLIAIDMTGQLDESWGGFISILIGHTNASFFKNAMKFVQGKIDKSQD